LTVGGQKTLDTFARLHRAHKLIPSNDVGPRAEQKTSYCSSGAVTPIESVTRLHIKRSRDAAAFPPGVHGNIVPRSDLPFSANVEARVISLSGIPSSSPARKTRNPVFFFLSEASELAFGADWACGIENWDIGMTGWNAPTDAG